MSELAHLRILLVILRSANAIVTVIRPVCLYASRHRGQRELQSSLRHVVCVVTGRLRSGVDLAAAAAAGGGGQD